MRVAALYDVHGNLPALEAVLAEVDRLGVDAIVAGGDVVWGARPAECLRRLREAGAVFVRGNCERETAARVTDADRWTARQLAEEELRWIAELPLCASLDGILFCHATPDEDAAIVTKLTPRRELEAAFGGRGARTVACGHTHQQFDISTGSVRIVNAGSVGLPYEGVPGAFWALFGDEVELCRTEYDVEAAAADVAAVGFPGAEVAQWLLDPPRSEEVTQEFENRARERVPRWWREFESRRGA